MKLAIAVAAVCTVVVLSEGDFAAEAGSKKPAAAIAVSRNGDWIVRVVRGDATKRSAKAFVFKFDAKSGLVASAQVALRNPVEPEGIYITDDGCYIVTLDDLHKGGVTDNAVVIYDLEKNVSKNFSLRDFLPQSVIDKIPSDMGMRLWRAGAVLDNDAMKLYPSGRVRDPMNPNAPIVVVDIVKMTVSMVSTSPTATQPPAAKANDAGKAKVAATVAISRGGDWVVRVVRGDSTKGNARALVFKFDDAKETFVPSGQVALRNPVEPEVMFVTEDGRYIVTLDDLHQIGVTDNAVVIYDLQKSVSKNFSLEDFLPKSVIDKIPWDMGMRLWRSGVVLDNAEMKLYPSGKVQDRLLPNHPVAIVDIVNMAVYLPGATQPSPAKAQ